MITTRHISRIIIHCSASKNGRALTAGKKTAAHVIDAWHRERKFYRGEMARQWNPGLSSIGYHLVIDVDGAEYLGRHPDEIGAHAKGYNHDSLGVCLVGTDAFTIRQWLALKAYVDEWRRFYPILQVVGHRDLPEVNKLCPGFDVSAWEAHGRGPVMGHIVNPPQGAAA